MKALLIYYSGSGNTLKIAELYKESFEKHGVETTIYPIKRIHEAIYNINTYDFLGIGYPIHAFNSPLIVEEFIKEMPVADLKKYFIFSSCGEPLYLNDSSSKRVEKILKKKGYFLTNEYHYCMPYNIMFRHTEAMAKKMYDTAKSLIPLDVDEILCGISHILKRPLTATIVKSVLKIEQPAMRLNGKFFKVDMTKCIKCMKCVENCPSKNISFTGDDFIFGTKCNMCTKCAFMCPKDAISIGILNNWRVNGEYDFIPKSEENTKHDRYLKKTYERYFKDADKRIAREKSK